MTGHLANGKRWRCGAAQHSACKQITHARTHAHTHTQPFNGLLSGTTWVGWYQKKHSPTHTHPDHRTSFITILHLQRSMASSLFSLRAWQSSRTTALQVLFCLPLGLGPSTSYSMHFHACKQINDDKYFGYLWKKVVPTKITMGWSDITVSMATIPSPFCGYNMA